MYNNTDITYSFNLDNYINSLESDYPFNDYKLLVNNKDYNTLSLEHERLMNEVNTMINSDMFSTEGIGDRIQVFIEWIKKTIKKIIEMVKLFFKRIQVFIATLSAKFRSKNDLYHKFKNKIFTSLDKPIKARRLHPDLLENLTDFYTNIVQAYDIIDDLVNRDFILDDYKDEFDRKSEQYAQDVNQAFDNLKDAFPNFQEQNIKEYIDSIFYAPSSKKEETTIKKFFNCSEGDTPKEINLLSDQYLYSLIRMRVQITTLIDMLQRYRDKIENFFKNINSVGRHISDNTYDMLKKITQNFYNFHTLNYNIFLEALKVRKNVSKFLIKGMLGDLFKDDEENKGSKQGDIVKIRNTYDFEVFRDFPNEEDDLYINGNHYTVVYDDSHNAIEIHLEIPKSYEINPMYERLQEFNKKYFPGNPTPYDPITGEKINGKKFIKFNNPSPHVHRKLFRNYMDGWEKIAQFRQSKEHREMFSYIENMLQGYRFRVNLQKHCMILNCAPIFSQKGSGFFIYILCTTARRKILPTDEYFHTVPYMSSFNGRVKDNKLIGFNRNMFLFSEERVYFGFGEAMGAVIGSEISKDSHRVYKLLTDGIGDGYVYSDPEEKKNEKRGGCYITAPFVPVVDVTDIYFDQQQLVNS